MSLPHEHYLLYLLSIPDITNEAVVELCQEYDLLIPDTPYITRLRNNLTLPKSYNVKTPNAATRTFWKRFSISDMWKNTNSVRKAMKILKNRKDRELVEYIILSPLELTSMKEELPSYINTLVFKLYRHYFYNIDLLDTDELKTFITHQGGISRSIAVCTDHGLAKELFSFITHGEDLNISSGALSKKIIDMLALRILRLKFSDPSEEDAAVIKNYAHTLRISQDIYSESSAASEELLDLFLRFKHGSEEEDLKTFEELKKGE